MLLGLGLLPLTTDIEEESVARPAFVHRENRDGVFDSICTKCFATVASSVWEVGLDKEEQQHICDPTALDRFAADHGRFNARGSANPSSGIDF